MIPSYRIPPFSKYVTWEGLGIHEESNKKWHKKEGMQSRKWCPSHKFLYVLYSLAQSFLLGFWRNSNNTTANSKKNTSKKESISVSETIWVQISANVGCFYIHVCLRIQLCLKMWFSTSFDIMWCVEIAIYAKNLFSDSIVPYF